jgi:hypothetical protein
MAELTQIELKTPIVEPAKPATDELVYNKMWMKRMMVESSDPQKKVRVDCTFAVCRDTENGKELKKPEITKNVRIGDLFGLLQDETISVETKTAMGLAMNQLIAALTAYAKEKDIF